MKRMRIYVVGRIGIPGQTERIEYIVNGLKNDFDVVSCLDRPRYAQKDWRDDFEGAKEELSNLEKYLAKNKFDAVVADLSAASDGRTNEQVILQSWGLPIYGFAPVPVTTPWRLVRVEKFFRDMDSLIAGLNSLSVTLKMEKKAREEAEEKKLRNPLYRLWGRVWGTALLFSVFCFLLIFLGTVVLSPIIILLGIVATILPVSISFSIRKRRKLQ